MYVCINVGSGRLQTADEDTNHRVVVAAQDVAAVPVPVPLNCLKMNFRERDAR